MSKFNVGDWVVYKGSSSPKQIGSIYVSNVMVFNNGKASWSLDMVELWEPKPGEWCWLRGIGLVQILIVRDYSYTFHKLYNSTAYEIFKRISDCEPFAGELPTHLKEQ